MRRYSVLATPVDVESKGAKPPFGGKGKPFGKKKEEEDEPVDGTGPDPSAPDPLDDDDAFGAPEPGEDPFADPSAPDDDAAVVSEGTPQAPENVDPMAAADPEVMGEQPAVTDEPLDDAAAADPDGDGQVETPDEAVAQQEWAGDLYEEGDETDPAGPDAFAAFNGQGGEAAWLDRAEDGTLTGWVQDAAGQVYRYSDVDAWAVDVDDAGMSRSDGQADPDPAADPAMTDPAAAGPGGVQEDPFAVQGKSLLEGTISPERLAQRVRILRSFAR